MKMICGYCRAEVAGDMFTMRQHIAVAHTIPRRPPPAWPEDCPVPRRQTPVRGVITL